MTSKIVFIGTRVEERYILTVEVSIGSESVSTRNLMKYVRHPWFFKHYVNLITFHIRYNDYEKMKLAMKRQLLDAYVIHLEDKGMIIDQVWRDTYFQAIEELYSENVAILMEDKMINH